MDQSDPIPFEPDEPPAEADANVDWEGCAECHPGARVRRRDVLRIGPWHVPVTALGWGLSLAAHAALAGAALLVVRGIDSSAGPFVRFSLGDGGHGTTGVFHEGGPGAAVEPELPPLEGAAPGATAGATAAPVTPGDTVPDAPPSAESFIASPLPEASRAPAPPLIGVGPATIPLPTPPGRRAAPVSLRGGGGSGSIPTAGRAPGGGGDGGGVGNGGALGAGRGTPEGTGGSGAGSGGEGTPGVPAGVAGGRLPAPVYPRESRRRGEQGRVVLEVLVEADGSVGEVRVLQDAGHPRLADAALDAVRQAHFTPAREGGVAVAAWVRVPFDFALR